MSGGERPVLRIVRGTPDDVELAALTAVLGELPAGDTGGSDGSGGSGDEAGDGARSAWADRARPGRGLPRPGPHAWRHSLR